MLNVYFGSFASLFFFLFLPSKLPELKSEINTALNPLGSLITLKYNKIRINKQKYNENKKPHFYGILYFCELVVYITCILFCHCQTWQDLSTFQF